MSHSNISRRVRSGAVYYSDKGTVREASNGTFYMDCRFCAHMAFDYRFLKIDFFGGKGDWYETMVEGLSGRRGGIFRSVLRVGWG